MSETQRLCNSSKKIANICLGVFMGSKLFKSLRVLIVLVCSIFCFADGAVASLFSPATSWQISGNTTQRAKDAFYFADKGNWKEAFQHADRSGDPAVKKIVRWRYYIQGQSRNFFEISAFIENNPNWPDIKGLNRQAENALNGSEPKDVLLHWFNRHPPLTAKGMQYYAEAQIASGLKDSTSINATKKLLKRAWVEGNFTTYDEKVFLQRHGSILTVSDYNERIARLLWDDRIDQAKRIMSRADGAHQKLFYARIALKRNQPGLDGALRAVPASLAKNEGLIYDRIKWRKNRRDMAGVRQLMPSVPLRSKYPDRWWLVKQSQIRDLIANKQYRIAYNLAVNHGLTEGENFADGEWLAGWIALRFLHDPKTAYQHFYALYHNVQYPVTLARAAYWAGRAAEANKSASIAKSWYSVAADHSQTFYGQLALAKIDRNATLKLSLAPKPSEQDKQLLRTNELAKAAYFLVITGQRDAVARLFVTQAVAVARTGGEKELVSNLMLSHKRYDLAVVASKQAARQGVLLANSGYPLISEVLGNPRDRARNLAIIRQESEFKKDARSPAGATGYMQLMPATAKMMARELRQPYSPTRLYTDGSFNISLGSRYLHKLINAFDGSYILAIASYNAGPGNVKKWIAQNGQLRDQRTVEDVVDWIERIPFTETRNYVHRVLENVQVYEMLLNADKRRLEDILLYQDTDVVMQEASLGNPIP